MSNADDQLGVRSVAAGLEPTEQAPNAPGPPRRKLDAFVGRWINYGHTVAREGVPAVEIVTSDVYEWAPGGFFLIHSAYGRIGEHPVGGVEIISHDPGSDAYVSRFFDSQGNESTSRLSEQDGVWTWTDAHTRAHASFSADGNVQTAHHETTPDGATWTPSMEVTLHRVP
jgi:hypothetical protein